MQWLVYMMLGVVEIVVSGTRHGIGIGWVTPSAATVPTTSDFLGGCGLGLMLLPPPAPSPPLGCVLRHRHRPGYQIPATAPTM